MKRFTDWLLIGAGFALGACVIWYVIWPWIRSW
jgi:hypothetical protein